MNDSQQPDGMTTRTTAVFLFGVIVVAAVGYLVGIHDGVPRDAGRAPTSSIDDGFEIADHGHEQSGHVPSDDVDSTASSEQGNGHDASVMAVTYREMRRTETGPTSGWKPTIDQIPQPVFDLYEEFKPSEEEKQQSTLTRASRRAFNGAPPIIPHLIERTDDAACYACHGNGMRIDDRVANQMSHPYLANCTQCHASPAPKPFADVDASVKTTFVGMPAPVKGERAFPGAPPTIPHSTWMRETCLACHGREAGWAGLESTHPWRVNCLQCHGPSAALDQATTAHPVPFLPEISIESP